MAEIGSARMNHRDTMAAEVSNQDQDQASVFIVPLR